MILLNGIGSLIEEKGLVLATSHESCWRQHCEASFRVLIWLLALRTNLAQQRHEEASCTPGGGGMHILPKDFSFPNVNALSAFKLWWFGNKSCGFPPFRLISLRDLSTASKKQTLSKWKLLMRHVHKRIEISTHQQTKDYPTQEEPANLFSNIDLEIEALTPAN